MFTEMDKKAVQAIRALSVDAIDEANSGHPGIVMGAAPMAYVLWCKIMKHNPDNPNWWNRDRFVLSAGHGSMLLYSLLHLSGYDLAMDEIKNFRKFGSKTAGHPEYKHTVGVEVTTGPLGQGIATAVGMALAERHLAEVYNKKDLDIINHNTYVLCGDGDLMEGVASESSSLAGHLQLGNLVVLYDSNDISLDGDLRMSFSEDVGKRYESYGWQYIKVIEGNNLDEVYRALMDAKEDTSRPTLIEVKTTIGYGSPNRAGSSKSHGAPLGRKESLLTKANWGWEHKPFHIPEEIYSHFMGVLSENSVVAENEWNNKWESYKNKYQELSSELMRGMNNELPEDWDKGLVPFVSGQKMSTRDAGGKVLNILANNIPNLLGGSADLFSSNKTYLNDKGDFSGSNPTGRNIWFGVREFAMGACLNGMMLHGGVKPFGSTFFVFSDYVRPAVRLSALMELPVVYVFTHDSVAVGEDGPTHEPVEHLASFRALPNTIVFRPADANETLASWKVAVEAKDSPSLLVLSRQDLPIIDVAFSHVELGVEKGAYVISKANSEKVDGILIATGSEVSIAIDAQKELEKENIFVSVVSMPAMDLFARQVKSYQEEVLPPNVTKRVAIEAGATQGWDRYVGFSGAVIGIDRFGLSGDGNLLMSHFGMTVDNIVATFKQL